MYKVIKIQIKYILNLLSIILLIIIFQNIKKMNSEDQLIAFFNKNEVTILVTDSGLGGLSIMADLENRLQQNAVFEKVNIVFFNALFDSNSGYNNIQSDTEKVRIFNTALNAMAEKYNPDLLLIACNTLSVIYHETTFSNNAPFPIIGIAQTGVDLIAQQFENNSQAEAIIFATNTTIESNYYTNHLVERGYSASKIINQTCPLLATYIEQGPSEITIALITEYITQAVEKIKNPKTPIFASLNCTHYGYYLHHFKKLFSEIGYPEIKIINPNPTMNDFIFSAQYLNRYTDPFVTVKVVSKTKINNNKKSLLEKLLKKISPNSATALKNYKYDPQLFNAQ